jgi:RNA polymerase sigma factor (sigma-70 family)
MAGVPASTTRRSLGELGVALKEQGLQRDGWNEGQIAALTEIANELPRMISPHVRGDVGAVEDLRQIVLTQLAIYVTKRALTRPEMVRLAHTIARRRIIDWYRKNQPLLLCPTDDILLLEAAMDVCDIADNVATRIDLERAMGRLSPQQRRAAVLFYLCGLSREDVADAMGITDDAVKKHLANGRKRARELDELAEYGRQSSGGGNK